MVFVKGDSFKKQRSQGPVSKALDRGVQCGTAAHPLLQHHHPPLLLRTLLLLPDIYFSAAPGHLLWDSLNSSPWTSEKGL